jgi:Fe-Mn family superoxide dismutase
MELHHQKHHNTYITNLNMFMEKQLDAEAKGDVSGMIANQQALKFNGGGHLNHSIFWKNLAPPSKGGGEWVAGSALSNKIEAQWGSADNFKTVFSAATVAVQGSGWGWLGYDKASDSLKIATTPNQDPLTASTGLVPLLGIDVWEHAYYLQYKNVRPDYLKEIWHVINWNDVSTRLDEASM